MLEVVDGVQAGSTRVDPIGGVACPESGRDRPLCRDGQTLKAPLGGRGSDDRRSHGRTRRDAIEPNKQRRGDHEPGGAQQQGGKLPRNCGNPLADQGKSHVCERARHHSPNIVRPGVALKAVSELASGCQPEATADV